jgi:hypothetical protein
LQEHSFYLTSNRSEQQEQGIIPSTQVALECLNESYMDDEESIVVRGTDREQYNTDHGHGGISNVLAMLKTIEQNAHADDQVHNYPTHDNASTFMEGQANSATSTEMLPAHQGTLDQQQDEAPTLTTEINEEDIEIFRHNESIQQAFSLSQEGESLHTPKIDMEFDTTDDAFKFYNEYALIIGFSAKKYGNYHSQSKRKMGELIRCIYKCNKCGVPPDQKGQEKQQKQGVQTSKKTVRQTSAQPAAQKRKKKLNEITNCPAEMVISVTSAGT